jgi:hypothetical protein
MTTAQHLDLLIEVSKKEQAESILFKVAESHAILWEWQEVSNTVFSICRVKCIRGNFELAFYTLGMQFGLSNFFNSK